MWNGIAAANGFHKAEPTREGATQVDEVGVVATEGEVGVEKEQAHEQPAQAEHGQKIGLAFVSRQVKSSL